LLLIVLFQGAHRVSPCIRYDRLSAHRPYSLLFIVLLQISSQGMRKAASGLRIRQHPSDGTPTFTRGARKVVWKHALHLA
jgi:hypothetical protein